MKENIANLNDDDDDDVFSKTSSSQSSDEDDDNDLLDRLENEDIEKINMELVVESQQIDY